MYYHHRYGAEKEERTISRRFVINLILLNLIIIFTVLLGVRLYNNYMVQRDTELIQSWCHQVLCVRIDPKTGIGTPAFPEAQPAQSPTVTGVQEI